MVDRNANVRSLIGLADLVVAYANEDLEVANLIAESIGLEFRPRPSIETIPMSISIPEFVHESTEQARPIQDATGYPKQIQPLSFWICNRFEQRESNIEENRPSLHESTSPVIRWRNAPVRPPIHRPLAPWSVLSERLKSALGLDLPSQRADITKLVNRVASGEVIATIPMQFRKHTQRLHVILDESIWLTPFYQDQLGLVSQLRGDNPSQTITIQTVRTIEDDIFVPPARDGLQVLVVSDLGEFTRSVRLKTRWMNWARAALANECHVLALVPCAATRISEPLQDLFRVVSWQSDPFTWISDQRERREVLKRLFVLTSYCRVVEPGLLRDMRSLIPAAADVSLEADYWNSKVLTTRHHCGASMNQEIRSQLQPEFKCLSPSDIRAEALACMRQWRSSSSPETWHLEVLNFPEEWRASLDSEDLEDAEECVKALDATCNLGALSERAQYDAYMHRTIPHLNGFAYSNPKVGKLLRAARFRLRPDLETIPDGTDPREIPADRLRHFTISMIDDQLLTFRDGIDNDHTVTSIRSSNGVFRIETYCDSTEPSFWKNGIKPDFVSAYGTDQYGAWFEFEVPRRDTQGVVTQRMRWIRPGTFMMGSPEDEPERFDDEVLHEVTLTRGFWLADTACTQSMWETVMEENRSRFKGAERPVECVSYDDVVAFCMSLSNRIPGLTPQLPTEAQWEYACRAGTQSPFSFGATISTDRANFDGNYPYDNAPKGLYREQTVTVKDLPCNAWGLYQMHGNVREWCSDWYADEMLGSQIDPAGPKMGSVRVLRGGGWFGNARNVRSACRYWFDPGYRYGSLGFRLLSSAGAEPSERAEVPVAEQGSEPSRFGAAEEFFRDFRVRVEDNQPTQLEIERATKIRVVSNLEAVELQQRTKPDWAIEFGRDAYGVYGDFELESTFDGSLVQQRLRWIPPGRFQMGSPPDEPGRDEDELLHPVTIRSGFWIFDTPCTQRLWTAIMGKNPSHFVDLDRPVESVSWDEANEFAEQLSQRWNRHPSNSIANLKFELPTEAQWEYACRAGTSTAIYTGPIEIIGDANAPALDAIAWYGGNSGHKYDLDISVDVTGREWLSNKQFPFTHAGSRQIKQTAPNPWGLYDMLGNVWEWCADWYAEYTGGNVMDPHGPESGSSRVLRGGSWISHARLVRSACRLWYGPGYRNVILGFRLLSSASTVPVPGPNE